eukprot:15473210-Alexandrium_andersonii.AAC.1
MRTWCLPEALSCSGGGGPLGGGWFSPGEGRSKLLEAARNCSQRSAAPAPARQTLAEFERDPGRVHKGNK